MIPPSDRWWAKTKIESTQRHQRRAPNVIQDTSLHDCFLHLRNAAWATEYTGLLFRSSPVRAETRNSRSLCRETPDVLFPESITRDQNWDSPCRRYVITCHVVSGNVESLSTILTTPTISKAGNEGRSSCRLSEEPGIDLVTRFRFVAKFIGAICHRPLA